MTEKDPGVLRVRGTDRRTRTRTHGHTERVIRVSTGSNNTHSSPVQSKPSFPFCTVEPCLWSEETMFRLRLVSLCVCLIVNTFSWAFVSPVVTTSHLPRGWQQSARQEYPGDDDNKFGFGQRIESIKTLAVGAIAGSFAMAPVSALHDFVLLPASNAMAQWEFDNDAASLEAGLFAIVYRYAVRTDENPQLKDGVVGAFALTRTLSRIVVPNYCTAITLNCGPPLEYLDWNMLFQLGVNFVESFALFGAAAAAINYCFYRNIIGKFP